MNQPDHIMALDVELPEASALPEDLEIFFRVCEDKLTRTPHDIGEADRQELRAAGFSEKDIRDIADIAGFYNMTNRVASAVDMQPNKEYHGMHR